MPQADLELALHRRDSVGDNPAYSIDLRFLDPASEADKRLSSGANLHFDPAELRQRTLDAAAYGVYLSGQLFAGEDVRAFFNEALAVAQARDMTLSLRLAIGPSAPELHGLRWETLRLPGGDAPLLTGEHLLFSRYLSGLDWRPVRLRPQADLRALVVIASPSDWAKKGVAEVKTEVELAAAHAGLGDIPTTALATPGQATLGNLAARLRDGCDILYLVAHGLLVDGEPQILLEREDGTGQWTAGRELATRVYELQDRPRLIVLVSCQSAGAGGGEPTTQDGGALAGLGPRLAEVGVPAVIAMQGNLTMKTAERFMPGLFTELRRDGQVDRAMAVARGMVRERPDWWMPVLFMRLRDGLVWQPAPPEALASLPRLDFEPETLYIPSGSFGMGSLAGDGAPPHETPQHEVTLPGYRIGKYPVTNAEYAAFLKERPNVPPPAKSWLMRRPPAGKGDHPVVNVSWREARAYCDWLSEKTKPRHYRLPTEAEWERAARGRANTRYPWGDDWRQGVCNVGGTGTTAVTAFETGASSYGCYDMLGNAEEWTQTIWGSQDTMPHFPYPYRSDDGREDPDASRYAVVVRRIVRGGSYANAAKDVRAAARSAAPEDDRLPWRGFRVVMEIPQTRMA